MKKFDLIVCLLMIVALNVISKLNVNSLAGFDPYSFGWIVGLISVVISTLSIREYFHNNKPNKDIVDLARDAYPEVPKDEPNLKEMIAHLNNTGEFSMDLLMVGVPLKRESWEGYWKYYDEDIYMHLKDGNIINLRQSDDISYTISNILARDWTIANSANTKIDL